MKLKLKSTKLIYKNYFQNSVGIKTLVCSVIFQILLSSVSFSVSLQPGLPSDTLTVVNNSDICSVVSLVYGTLPWPGDAPTCVNYCRKVVLQTQTPSLPMLQIPLTINFRSDLKNSCIAATENMRINEITSGGAIVNWSGFDMSVAANIFPRAPSDSIFDLGWFNTGPRIITTYIDAAYGIQLRYKRFVVIQPPNCPHPSCSSAAMGQCLPSDDLTTFNSTTPTPPIVCNNAAAPINIIQSRCYNGANTTNFGWW